ncbi:MAG: prepilin peptidase [Acidimicrobiales bacterium]
MVVLLLASGLAIGPLLGIAVDRVVERVALAPSHRCVHCRAELGPRSLVPIVSWVQRCDACGEHKGRRYPAVDLVTAVTFALIGLRFGSDWRLVPYLAVGAVLVVLSAVDLETHLLPNIVVWPSILVGLFMVLVLSGELADGVGISTALVGAAVFGGFIGIAHLVNEAGMGRGDVKLAVLLGLFVGWPNDDPLIAVRLVLYALFLALLGGGLVGIVYNLIRRRGRAEIPFGPALAAGAVFIILLTPRLVDGASP